MIETVPTISATINYSARRINTLAKSLQIQNYLEIGVSQGATFLAVNIPEKTAVDPKFAFDISTVIDQKTTFHEETSDQFYSTASFNVIFDLIFLDGLHTFEQTYRDFCNSLLHCHAKTVFLIDDTLPNDVYSSLRDWEKTMQRRKDAGVMSTAWHGDTFKTVFALHDFHPGLNYRTIVGSGNPQTLVWRSNLGWRQPLFDSLEQISRLTYFDLMDHKYILRECSEDEAINLCLKEIA